MPRRLKSFTTSAGFFDLAVAAPSMKAALEAWGAGANLFHQGFAKESHDVDVVTATMAKPGVVLRRPVGTHDDFTENAEASGSFVGRSKPPLRKTRPAPPKAVDRSADRKAALAYERQEAQRERQERKDKSAQQRERERREQAIEAAEAALHQAGKAHGLIVKEIDKAQEELDRKSIAEKERWEKEKNKLQDALREARSPRHLRVV